MRTTDIIAGIVALLIVLSAWKLHRVKGNNFNVFDLVMENGRLSRMACVFVGAFAIYSWVIVRLALDGKMSEGYMIGYGGVFVAPIIAKLFSPAPEPLPPGTTTIKSSTVVEETKDIKQEPPAPPKKGAKK